MSQVPPPPLSLPHNPGSPEEREPSPAPTSALTAALEVEPQPRASLGRRLARSISNVAASSILTLGLSSVGGILVARAGGPGAYAAFVSASMLVYLAAMVAQCGLPWAVARFVALEEEAGRWPSVQRASTATMLLLGVLALAISLPLVVLLPWIERALHVDWGRAFVFWLPVALLGAMAADGADGIYFGLLRAQRNLLITSSGPLVLVIVLALRRLGVEPFALWPAWSGVVASCMASGACALVLLALDGLWVRPSALGHVANLRGEMEPVWRGVLPAASFSLFPVFGAWIDRALVGWLLGAAGLGLYACASSLLQVALRVPVNLSYLLLPASLKASADAPERDGEVEERSQSLLDVSVRAFGLCASAAAAALWIGGPWVLTKVFGAGFAPAAPALQLMAPALLASAVSAPALMALKSTESNRLVTPLLLLMLPLRAILLAALTPTWGLSGAALAFSLSECAGALGCALALRRARVRFPFAALGPSFIAGAVSLACANLCLQLHIPVAAALLAGAVPFVLPALPLLSRLRQASRSS